MLLVLAMAWPATAKMYQVGKDTLHVTGYISQGAQISALGNAKDVHDTASGLNQAITTGFVELDYQTPSDWRFYGSGKATVDWAYDLRSGDDEWLRKEHNLSRENLYLDDEWWQLIPEAHVTWTPGDFLFRFGKQIVSWGEADFLRVMDSINPVDSRRGFADVEFEETVIPIPMLRGEYWPDIADSGGFLSELGMQVVLIPNADYIPDLGPDLSNANSGVWSGSVVVPDDMLGAGTPTRIEINERVKQLEDWSDWEVGVRLQALIGSSVATLNGFYGRANSPVSKIDVFGPSGGIGSKTGSTDSEGNTILELDLTGFHPRQKFVGATLATEIPQFSFSALGGSTPVIRTEVKYEFDKYFNENFFAPVFQEPFDGTTLKNDGFIVSDSLESMVGVDWKFSGPWWRWLNSSAYLDTSFQFFWNRVMDYPKDIDYVNAGGLDTVHVVDQLQKDTYLASAYIQTTYLNAKLVPSFAYLRDFSNQAELMLLGLSYSPTSRWSYSASYGYHNGDDLGQSLEVFKNKDYIAFKVRYTF